MKYALNDRGNVTLSFPGRKNIGQFWKYGVIALGRGASKVREIHG
jgi:hypothetical protein